MKRASAQPDLFDLLAPAAPRLAPPAETVAEEVRHLIVATLTRASTACGIAITDYQFMARFGTAIEDGRKVLCTHYAYDGTVSCVRCLEEMRG